MKALLEVTHMKLTPEVLQGGKNPGALLCDILGGSSQKNQIIFGRNSSGNLASYCRFSDGSIVNSESLMDAARGEKL